MSYYHTLKYSAYRALCLISLVVSSVSCSTWNPLLDPDKLISEEGKRKLESRENIRDIRERRRIKHYSIPRKQNSELDKMAQVYYEESIGIRLNIDKRYINDESQSD